MFFVDSFLSSILLPLIIASPQINLYFTDFVNNNNNNKDDVVFQHDCLHVVASIERDMDPYQVISYCLSESPSEWTIKENNLDHKLTFAELYQQHITSQQLYLWSASMDIVERYQLYLNELSTANNSSSMASH